MAVPINAIVSNGIGTVSDDQINTFVQIDQTLAQLRQFVGKSGMTTILQGAAAPGDGNGGVFYWQNGIFTDDGLNTIVPPAAAGIGAWKRIILFVSGVTSVNGQTGIAVLGVADITGAAPLAGPTFTGTPSAPTAIPATNNTQLATTAFVWASLAIPPAYGSTTPNAVSATTLSATGLISPSTTAGIKGTTLADSAQAGSVGETITTTVLAGAAVALTTTVAANIAQVILNAGDWDVWATIAFAPAGTTTVAAIRAGISTTTATLPTIPGAGASLVSVGTLTTGATQSHPVGMTRINVSVTTTVFLVASADFGVSTMGGYGFIGARRVR